MTYCAIDFGKREYDFNVSGISNRSSSKILGCFVYLARKFPNLVWDRFGIIDDNSFAESLPRYTNTSLFEAVNKRVKDFDVPYIAWSGGIDSSYIVAAFIANNRDFKVLYNEQSVISSAGKVIFDCLKQSGVECIFMDRLSDYSGYSTVLTGDGADILFSPGNADLFIDSPILSRGIRLSVYDTLKYVYPVEADHLYGQIVLYSSRLNRSINNDVEISRLMQWGCFYYFKRDYFRVITGADANKMIPFFDTTLFKDISYSSFWNSRYENGHKQLQRKYISKVFGNRSLYSLLIRNPSPYLRPINASDYHRF